MWLAHILRNSLRHFLRIRGGRSGFSDAYQNAKGEMGVNQLFLHGWETVVIYLIHYVDEGLSISLGETSHIGRAPA